MKYIKKITVLTLLSAFVLTSCDKKVSERNLVEMSELESEEFFKQNISIYDAIVRSINKIEYVKELNLKNFSERQWDKTSVGFDGCLFEDNGQGYDIIANDNIYTSVRKFSHSPNIPFIEGLVFRSVLETPIVSPDFKKIKELENFSVQYKLKRSTNYQAKIIGGPIATIECDVKICSKGCLADWIWSGFGCICVSNCRAKIGWR